MNALMELVFGAQVRIRLNNTFLVQSYLRFINTIKDSFIGLGPILFFYFIFHFTRNNN